MKLLNVPDDIISQIRLEALKQTESETTQTKQLVPTFEYRELPPDTRPINDWLEEMPEKLVPILEYIAKRNLYLDYYNFHWTPKIGFSNRLIVPFYKDAVCVGYTARAINDVKPKYISEQQPGYVFNLDAQQNNRQFVIVCEGPFDAISIDGCALLGAEIKESQNWLLKQLGKEIILVPDRDHEGPRTVEQAIEYGWSVSMPDWPEGIKDVNDAYIKLGRLATLWMIINSKESNSLKIQLKSKKWFKEHYAKDN